MKRLLGLIAGVTVVGCGGGASGNFALVGNWRVSAISNGIVTYNCPATIIAGLSCGEADLWTFAGGGRLLANWELKCRFLVQRSKCHYDYGHQ